MLAKATEPGLPVGVYYYGGAGQRWALGGGLAPRLLPARTLRAPAKGDALAPPPAAGPPPGLTWGALLGVALGACAGAAVLVCVMFAACGWCSCASSRPECALRPAANVV